MIDKTALSEILRDNDALSEEHQDMPGFWGQREVDVEALSYVAMQRGLRVVMIDKGLSPNHTRRITVSLNQREQAAQITYAGCFMDGFAAGFEAATRAAASQ